MTSTAGLLAAKKLSKEFYVELRSLVDAISGPAENLKFLDQEFIGVSERIVVHLIARPLDETTKKQWEPTIKRGELPSFENTIQFLKGRVSILERCHDSSKEPGSHRATVRPVGRQPTPRANTVTTSPTTDQECEMCGDCHPTFKCSSFNSLDASDRLSKVKKMRLCFNCQIRGHSAKNYLSMKSCSTCRGRHHN